MFLTVFWIFSEEELRGRDEMQQPVRLGTMSAKKGENLIYSEEENTLPAELL